MKPVSFNVAKAIKDAGYPQDIEFWKYLEDSTYWYYQDGALERKGNMSYDVDVRKLIFAPTYIDVWIWLWREKKIYITFCEHGGGAICSMSNGKSIFNFSNKDPEEAITAAIKDLVDNNLIK